MLTPFQKIVKQAKHSARAAFYLRILRFRPTKTRNWAAPELLFVQPTNYLSTPAVHVHICRHNVASLLVRLLYKQQLSL